jgi:hypothetical protein
LGAVAGTFTSWGSKSSLLGMWERPDFQLSRIPFIGIWRADSRWVYIASPYV